MESRKAAAQIEFIWSQVARSECFRGYRPVTVATTGLLGIAAAIVQPFVVPARGENEFDMTVRTNFVSSIGRLLSRMNGRDNSKVSYAIAGKVAVDIPFVKAIPFQDAGSLDLGMLR